jgi:transcriptional regulator with XRE-family HTH domain
MARRARKASRKKKAPAAKGLSLRALAKRLGVSHTAVRKGVESGRLSASIARGKVIDVGLARTEWAAGATKEPPKETGGGTLVQAQLEATRERTIGLRLANRLKRGRLVDAETARRDAFDCARAVRDAVLNIPDRVAAELAAETDPDRVHARLDDELRKALEAAAEVLARGE